MSSGRICPGSLAQNETMPMPPAAVYSVMKIVAPAIARPSVAMKPPCWPPTEVPVWSWIAHEIHASSPDSAKTCSPGWSSSSRTGMVVPMIRCSTSLHLLIALDSRRGQCRACDLLVVHVVEHASSCGPAAPRALVADADHEDVRAHRAEAVQLP